MQLLRFRCFQSPPVLFTPPWRAACSFACRPWTRFLDQQGSLCPRPFRSRLATSPLRPHARLRAAPFWQASSAQKTFCRTGRFQPSLVGQPFSFLQGASPSALSSASRGVYRRTPTTHAGGMHGHHALALLTHKSSLAVTLPASSAVGTRRASSFFGRLHGWQAGGYTVNRCLFLDDSQRLQWGRSQVPG